jgi:hypothetical protein
LLARAWKEVDLYGLADQDLGLAALDLGGHPPQSGWSGIDLRPIHQELSLEAIVLGVR